MLTHLPLDDELNQLFYVDEGICRLVWANALGRCVLRQEKVHIALADAVAMIARGDLLWVPPEQFASLEAGAPVDVVQREFRLLRAFLISPACMRLAGWTTHQRLERRLIEERRWLAERALSGGDVAPPEEG